MDEKTLARSIEVALTGRQAHPDPVEFLADVDAETAGRRPPGAPHGIAELVGHVVWWLELTVAWLEGVEPADPAPGETWPVPPGAIADADWAEWRRRFATGLAKLRSIAERGNLDSDLPGLPDVPCLDAFLVQATHQSWHLGQAMLLTRLLA